MPLYEYRCRACGHQFEALVRGTGRPVCPSCRGDDLEQLVSLFGVSSETTRQANLQAGRKRLRKDQRDKAIAEQEESERHHD